MIAWPTIIKYRGSDELAYVADQRIWNADPHLCAYRYDAGDRLIDSAGTVYALVGQEGFIAPSPVGTATLAEVVDLVRAHAVGTGSCCIAKFDAASVAEAIAIAARLD